MRTLVAVVVAATSSSALADVPFTPLADFGLGGSPFDVNAAGVIVGGVRVDTGPGPYLPVFWPTSASAPVELPTVNGGYAVAINSIGDIVGTEFQPAGVYGIAILWSNGTRTELPDLGEGAFAVDINEAGVIAGNVIVNGEYRAARWVDGELEVLPLPPFDVGGGELWSVANSINSAGVITGTIPSADGSRPIATPELVADLLDSRSGTTPARHHRFPTGQCPPPSAPAWRGNGWLRDGQRRHGQPALPPAPRAWLPPRQSTAHRPTSAPAGPPAIPGGASRRGASCPSQVPKAPRSRSHWERPVAGPSSGASRTC
jgi:hypothetical protein